MDWKTDNKRYRIRYTPSLVLFCFMDSHDIPIHTSQAYWCWGNHIIGLCELSKKVIGNYVCWRHKVEMFSTSLALREGIHHRSPVDSPHKGQWLRALMPSLVRVWTNNWAENRGTGDLRRYCDHYDVTVTVIRTQNAYIILWVHCIWLYVFVLWHDLLQRAGVSKQGLVLEKSKDERLA